MINISVRGNIHNTDVQLLQREASYFFQGIEELAFYRKSEQIDPGFVSITADALVATAAFLYIYLELVKHLGKVDNENRGVVQKSNLDYVNPTRLRRLLDMHFDIEELRTLCIDLGVEYDNLRGEGKTAKIRELIAYLERRAWIHELVEYVRDQRPRISWSDISQELSYDELSADARKIMAERGVTKVKIIDIIGFPDKAHVNPEGLQDFPREPPHLGDSEKQPPVQSFNLKNIRTLLIEGFTDEELRRLCYYESDFRPVYDQLAQGMGKDSLIDKLVEYAERRELIETLLAIAKERNPTKYERYQPYHVVTTGPTISSGVHGKSQRTNLDKPCIITFLDSKTNTPFKVFYHSSENTYEIRIART